MESTAYQPDAAAGTVSRTHLTLAVLIIGSFTVYLSRFGHEALGASEAFSAWVAAKPGARAILDIPVLFDPGKQILYYLLLHYFTLLFGLSESALRALSVIFAIASLPLVYAIGRELFDAETGVAAVAIWCFNPLAMIFANRARGYSMLLFVGLVQFHALWRLRERPGAGRTLWCGFLGALLLFTHLAGIMLLGAEGAMMVRDFIRGRRAMHPWLAMLVTAVMFVPYLPIAASQGGELVSGHWLDWIGTPHYLVATRIAVATAAAALTIMMVLGPKLEPGEDEPLRWVAAWSVLPLIAFIAGSILVRPMFTPRYALPSFAGLAILVAGGLAVWSVKVRNLAAGGFAVAFLLMMPYTRVGNEPWPALVHAIEAAHAPSQPIFFETGFIEHGAADIGNGGFPFGYYAIPFNYYFHGPNPRVIIPGSDPDAARAQITAGVQAAGGGWLVSWKDDATPELPDAHAFRITPFVTQQQLAIYRIVPVKAAPTASGR